MDDWTDGELTTRECVGTGECSVQSGMGQRAQEVTIHETRGGRCVRTTGGQIRKVIDTGQGISLASPNIHTGRVGGLEMELQALHQGNVDLGFLQETNLMQGMQTWRNADYDVWSTEVQIRNWGGFVVVWIAEKGW